MTKLHLMLRRDFLRNLVITTGGLVVAPSLLSACGTSASSTGELVIGTPTNPTKLPSNGEAIADGLTEEKGTLEILNWADYTNPEVIADFEKLFGVTVKTSIYDTEESAIAKLRNGTFKPDLVIGLTDTALARLSAAKLLQPINKSYIPHFSNLIDGLQNPYYDVDSQFTVANVIYANGIAYRTDRIDGSTFTSGNGYDAMWDAAHKGKLAVLDSYRDTISLAMFQAGMNDVNTSDADVLAAAKENLVRLRDATNPKVDIISYQELPAGNRDIAYTWSGDVLTALGYLPDGTSPETLGFWYPDQTITANDFYCIPKESKAPVLAHKFIDYILDTDVALKNQSYVGYQPALSTITVDNLLANGTIPESLKDSLVTPEKYASGQRLVSLNPDADALWLDVWASFTAG